MRRRRMRTPSITDITADTDTETDPDVAPDAPDAPDAEGDDEGDDEGDSTGEDNGNDDGEARTLIWLQVGVWQRRGAIMCEVLPSAWVGLAARLSVVQQARKEVGAKRQTGWPRPASTAASTRSPVILSAVPCRSWGTSCMMRPSLIICQRLR